MTIVIVVVLVTLVLTALAALQKGDNSKAIGSRANKPIEGNATRHAFSEDQIGSNPELESKAIMRHLDITGHSKDCYDVDKCLLPKNVHFSSLLYERETVLLHEREFVENWIDWREMEMARAAAASEVVHEGKRVWHTDEKERIVPCNRHVKRCPYETKHFDTHEDAVKKLPKYFKPYIIIHQDMTINAQFRAMVTRIYEDRLILEKNPNFFKNYESVDELLEEHSRESKAPTVNIAPETLVKDVKVEIGGLRADICWVIDNPAFFDDHSPVTNELFTKLAEWDDRHKSWENSKVREASTNIKNLFETAKKEAATLGFDYLHGKTRKSMETASSLVHKALSTTHEHEQVALMEKVAAILSETLGLAIPRQAVKAVEAYVKKGLTATIEQPNSEISS